MECELGSERDWVVGFGELLDGGGRMYFLVEGAVEGRRHRGDVYNLGYVMLILD